MDGVEPDGMTVRAGLLKLASATWLLLPIAVLLAHAQPQNQSRVLFRDIGAGEVPFHGLEVNGEKQLGSLPVGHIRRVQIDYQVLTDARARVTAEMTSSLKLNLFDDLARKIREAPSLSRDTKASVC